MEKGKEKRWKYVQQAIDQHNKYHTVQRMYNMKDCHVGTAKARKGERKK